MKKLLYRILIGLILFIILFISLNSIFSNYGDLNTAASYKKIQDKDNVDILIMGNSQCYTNIDAQLMSELLNKDVYVLASNAQNMPMTLANLKTTLKCIKPEFIMIEEYSIMIDSYNNLNNASLGMAYTNSDSINNLFDRYLNVKHYLNSDNILSSLFPILRSGDMYTRFTNEKTNLNDYINSDDYRNGTSFRKTFGTLKDETIVNVYNSYLELENKYKDVAGVVPKVNMDALIELLELTKKENIEVIFFKAPSLDWDNQSYIMYDEIRNVLNNYEHVRYFENSIKNYEEIGLNKLDFYDEGHMSFTGCEKYSYYLANQVAELKGLNINNDTYVIGQYYELIDNKYYYEIKVLNKQVDHYQFIITDKNGNEVLNEISNDNNFTCEYDVIKDDGEYDLKIIIDNTYKVEFMKNKGATIN